jgi:flagellar biosynthesis protein FlhF
VPLESFTGRAVDTLLARARLSLGPDAEIIAVRTHKNADGVPVYQVLATDPHSARDERRRMGPDGGHHRLLKASPGAEEFARGRLQDPAPRLVAFVGPTGAGKTTSIAKLATHPEFFRRKRVGLLCLDTYRVGAVEQLRTYAEIAGLPFEVLYDSGDLPTAMQRLADRDLILVDTPGRGPRHHDDAQQVRQWLLRLTPDEVHLALPAGLQPDLVRRIVESHRQHGVTHLLPTKLDEAPDDWTAFDLAAQLRLPMRWMADGQEVPRDLKAAAPRLLAAVAALRDRALPPAETTA